MEAAVQNAENSAETLEMNFTKLMHFFQEEFKKFISSGTPSSEVNTPDETAGEANLLATEEPEIATEEASAETEVTDSIVSSEEALFEAEESEEPVGEPTVVEYGENGHSTDEVVAEPTLELKKPDFEVKVDEVFSIKVVAHQVMDKIEALQQEVNDLRAQMQQMITAEDVEQKAVEAVRATMMEKFSN
jgi:hypothetical protein